MTTTTGPIAYRLAPALLVCTMALAAWNWYLVPERAASWLAALLFLAVIAVVLGVASRVAFRAAANERPRRLGADQIGTAIVLTTLLLAFSLGVQLATTLGVVEDPDLAKRGTMVFIGLYFVLMGNSLPKRLTPLSLLQCDGAREQAFLRFSGWAWVLAGLGYAACWLVLPLDVAKPASIAVIGCGMLAVLTQMVRMRWTRRREA